MKAFDKIAEGLKQALAYARGDCDHDWERGRTTADGGQVKRCTKCGVRITTYPGVQ